VLWRFLYSSHHTLLYLAHWAKINLDGGIILWSQDCHHRTAIYYSAHKSTRLRNNAFDGNFQPTGKLFRLMLINEIRGSINLIAVTLKTSHYALTVFSHENFFDCEPFFKKLFPQSSGTWKQNRINLLQQKQFGSFQNHNITPALLLAQEMSFSW